VTLINLLPGFERLIPFLLFALYLLTAVRVCRYSSWVRAGAPNPFLPRSLEMILIDARVRRIA
jgi:hypothetical protein